MTVWVDSKQPLFNIYRAICTSLGKKPKTNKVFTDAWVQEQLLAEDSIIEFCHINIYDEEIRGDVANQIVRATTFHPRFSVQSWRPDWNEGDERPKPSSEKMAFFQFNPKALIYFASQRLCTLAMDETQAWVIRLKKTLSGVEGDSEDALLMRNLGKLLVPDCIYRGSCKKGSRSCGGLLNAKSDN